jgi:hypothetical protein
MVLTDLICPLKKGTDLNKKTGIKPHQNRSK